MFLNVKTHFDKVPENDFEQNGFLNNIFMEVSQAYRLQI
jgi:hypothetical protein